MKKILLGLGTLITIVVPLTEIISCGSHNFKDGEDFKKINLNSRMNKKEYEKAVKPFIDPIISLDKLEAKAGANDATEIDKKIIKTQFLILGFFYYQLMTIHYSWIMKKFIGGKLIKNLMINLLF